MGLQVLKSSVDSQTGHATLLVQVVERDPATGKLTKGPVMTEGIDHKSLTARYSCPKNATPADVDQALTRWLGDRHSELLAHKRALDQRSQTIHNLSGRTLIFGESDPAFVSDGGS